MGSVTKKKKMTPRRQRMYFIIFSGLCVALACFLILTAFRDNIVFFRTPSDLITKPVKAGDRMRIGGLVKKGSISENIEGIFVFVVTDTENEITVKYSGTLPSLFREGQGVVANGTMNEDGTFLANEILAKHDEKYMPPEVYKDLKERGYKVEE